MRLKFAVITLACAAARLLFCPPVYSGPLPAQAEAPPDLWKYMHPDAKFIAGVDWAKAKNSPAGRVFSKQLAAPGGKFTASGAGLEIFSQFERLMLSGAEALAGTPGSGDLIIAAEGKLDRAALKKSLPAGTAVERFKGIDLFVPPKSKQSEMLLAIVSDRLALFGDRGSIARALEQSGGASDPALVQRAGEMAARCEIWMVASSPGKPGGEGGAPGMKQLEEIESLDFGIQLQRGLGLKLNLIAKSEDSAKGLAMLAQIVSSMSTQNQQQSPEIASILRALHVDVDGKTVRMNMDVPLAQLERGLIQARSSAQATGRKTLESLLGIQPSGQPLPGLRPAVRGVRQAGIQGQTVTLPMPPPQPEPPKTRTIRIVGGEGGEKEITYTTGGKRD